MEKETCECRERKVCPVHSSEYELWIDQMYRKFTARPRTEVDEIRHTFFEAGLIVLPVYCFFYCF